MASGFTWDTSQLESPVVMERKLLRAVQGVTEYWDGPAERHMKHHAPWTDRTTNARNGLLARAYRKGRAVFGIVLAHSVDYGVYLEAGTENMRARPIIWPTVQMFAPKVVASLTKILDRMG